MGWRGSLWRREPPRSICSSRRGVSLLPMGRCCSGSLQPGSPPAELPPFDVEVMSVEVDEQAQSNGNAHKGNPRIIMVTLPSVNAGTLACVARCQHADRATTDQEPAPRFSIREEYGGWRSARRKCLYSKIQNYEGLRLRWPLF